MCTVLPIKSYKVLMSGLGLDDPGVRLHVVREALSWGMTTDQLTREGSHFVGSARLEPGDMWLVAITGLSEPEARTAFEMRRKAGLLTSGERFSYGNGLFHLTCDDRRFPRSSVGMPYPYNTVPV